MAFTPFERQLITRYFNSYSGKLPGGEYDETKIQDFMIADEAGKRTLLKTMVSDELLPQSKLSSESLQASRQDLLQRIAVMSAYVSV